MNTTILKKVIDSLREENPKIDYVLGMLETLYEMQDKPATSPATYVPVINTRPQDLDETAMLEAKAISAVETIKALNLNSEV